MRVDAKKVTKKEVGGVRIALWASTWSVEPIWHIVALCYRLGNGASINTANNLLHGH
jgi:hypothetical protein